MTFSSHLVYLGLVLTWDLNTFLKSLEDRFDSQPMDIMSIDGLGNGGDEFWRRELFDVLVCRIFVDTFNILSTDDATMLVIVALVESLWFGRKTKIH